MTPDSPEKLEIDWLKTAAGAFAAVSSAFLLSTLGAAGTIIGAALGSVIVTVGGALYTQGLARSQQRLAQVQTAAMRKVGVAQAEVRRAARQSGDGEPIDEKLAQAEGHLDGAKGDLASLAEDPPSPGWRQRIVALPWKRISLIAAELFVAAVLAITAFELVAGRSVSSITGGTDGDDGTTIGRIGGGSGEPTEDDRAPSDDQPSPSDAPSGELPEEPPPTSIPTDEPTSSSEGPSPTAPTSDTVPTDATTSSPTG